MDNLTIDNRSTSCHLTSERQGVSNANAGEARPMLLAIAQTGSADYLVSGDKRHLALKRHGNAQIVTVRTMLEIVEQQN